MCVCVCVCVCVCLNFYEPKTHQYIGEYTQHKQE
jgi:hypothetical protein